MISLAPEIEQHVASGSLSAREATPLLNLERRTVFSIHHELRFVVYLGVLLLVSGLGIIVKDNLERIGPLAIFATLLATSLALFAWTFARRRRRGELTIIEEYVALLAALLLSAAVGVGEVNFGYFGQEWAQHFLLLGCVHAIAAYLLRSPVVLSLSLASFAAWFGLQRDIVGMFESSARLAFPALTCAALFFAWREVHRRANGPADFLRVIDHFALNLMLLSGVAFIAEPEFDLLGLIVLAAGVTIALFLARLRASDAFLAYAIGYALVGVSTFVVRRIVETGVLLPLYFVFAFSIAIVTFFVLRTRWKPSE